MQRKIIRELRQRYSKLALYSFNLFSLIHNKLEWLGLRLGQMLFKIPAGRRSFRRHSPDFGPS